MRADLTKVAGHFHICVGFSLDVVVGRAYLANFPHALLRKCGAYDVCRLASSGNRLWLALLSEFAGHADP